MNDPADNIDIPIRGERGQRSYPKIGSVRPKPESPGARQPADIAIDTPDPVFGEGDSPLSGATGHFRRPPKKPRRLWPYLLLLMVIVMAGVAVFGYFEAQTSTFQARYISLLAKKLQFKVADGASDSIAFPKKGPYDLRLGYVQLPTMVEKLKQKGLTITRQSRFNNELKRYSSYGFFIPFDEKSQAGLHILDARDTSMYQMANPRRVYAKFSAIPPPVIQALLYIENRDLLSDQFPKVNPAIDWGRFSKALIVKTGELININLPPMGGSTLATQTEKFRHSDSGITSSVTDKLIQMVSASVRAYHFGENTSEYRRQLVLDYVNSVPLSAAPGAGEVNGLGDGMFVWFDTDFDDMNRLLHKKQTSGQELEQQAKVLKQVISLMIAHRRPSYYLVKGRSDLGVLANSYARLLAQNGTISNELSEAVQTQPLFFRNFKEDSIVSQIATDKGVNVVRNRLSSMFDTSLYDLDRMDITVKTSLDSKLQENISRYLKNLEDPEFAEAKGLIGKFLLSPDQTEALSYSFTLFERTPVGNLVRVQTDTTELPFDINEGSKLELGSTAKLRTLATYLEIIAELHSELSKKKTPDLEKSIEQSRDTLTSWVGSQLLQNPRLRLLPLLEAAMARPYSANPEERFFTGGGLHIFSNFRKEDDGRVVTVTEALQNSINLPFVRILKDIVDYIRTSQWEDNRQLLVDDKDPRRKEVLDKFIDQESKVFMTRFWNKYASKNNQQRFETLLTGMNLNPLRLTVIYRYLFPKADEATYIRFIHDQLPTTEITNSRLSIMYDKYKPGAFNLHDLGYLAALHPLELWLLDYLQQPGDKSPKDAMEKSGAVRRDTYNWLMRAKAKDARDTRVRIVLEIEAFSDIHRRWASMGYPFEHLVPSLATALGSSGDKPAALAELVGIILNDGKRFPTYRFTKVEFAKDTPYESVVEPPVPDPVQVLRPEVAHVLQETMGKVVSEGTAKRLNNSFQPGEGSPFPIGGKTGTGDNRIFTATPAGQKTASKALSRTATFVFYLGDNHFGTLTAFVNGNSANAFSFTSALPLQVLKGMVPILQPYIKASNEQL